eukprot:417062-Prymnesium_polylepis.1
MSRSARPGRAPTTPVRPKPPASALTRCRRSPCSPCLQTASSAGRRAQTSPKQRRGPTTSLQVLGFSCALGVEISDLAELPRPALCGVWSSPVNDSRPDVT